MNYIDWMLNGVLFKKSSGSLSMCFVYIYINITYPKDTYLLCNIDKLADKSSKYLLLSLLDAYFKYN